MPTAYEARVQAVKDQVLEALREHSTDAELAGLQILAAASPASVAAQPGGGGPLLRPPPPAESALLANAVIAAALHLAAQAAASGMQVMALRVGPGEQPAVAHLLDAILYLAAHSPAVINPVLPANCLEVLIDAVTNAECGGLFAYLDSRISAFQRPGVMLKSKNTLLRSCNLLLARLSKSQNALLCGRVLTFLAKFMRLMDESGLNKQGAFNTANISPVEEVAEGALDAEGRPIDAAFYKTFWGLQAVFSNPTSVLLGTRWAEASRSMSQVLDKMQAEKVTVGEAAAVLSPDGGDSGTSVKYLSSARLLPLQLRDASFRRHFLVQCLVLMSWAERPDLKDWAARALKGKPLEELQELRQRVYAVLEATPDNGPQFAAAIRGLMVAEDAWVAWKAAGCPAAPLERPPAVPPPGAADADIHPPRKRRKPSAEAVYGVGLGTDELDRLWNITEDNVSALSADDRGGFRSLRSLMEPVIGEMNEAAAEGGEEGTSAFEGANNNSYCWKTLRMLARDSLVAYSASVKAGGDLRVAARALYPTEVPPVPQPQQPQPEQKPQKASAPPVAASVPAPAPAAEAAPKGGGGDEAMPDVGTTAAGAEEAQAGQAGEECMAGHEASKAQVKVAPAAEGSGANGRAEANGTTEAAQGAIAPKVEEGAV